MNDRKVDYPVLNEVAVDQLGQIKELVREYSKDTCDFLEFIDTIVGIGDGVLDEDFGGLYGQDAGFSISDDEGNEIVVPLSEYWEDNHDKCGRRPVQILRAINKLLEVV